MLPAPYFFFRSDFDVRTLARGKVRSKGCAQAGLAIQSKLSVGDGQRFREDIVVPAVNIAANDLLDHRIRNMQHHVRRCPQSYGTDGVVQRDWQVVGVGEAANFSRLCKTAAPGEIRHNDVGCGLLDIFAKVEAGERALALANGDLGARLEADEGLDVVRRHDFFQPHHIVGFERVGDLG